MLRSTLRGNAAFGGGSLALGDSASGTVSVSTLRDGVAAFGGAVTAEHGASLSITASVLRGNAATSNGGAAHATDTAKLTVNRTWFT